MRGRDGFLPHHAPPAGIPTEGCLITVTYSVADESSSSFCQGITFLWHPTSPLATQLLLDSHCEGVDSGAFDLSFITQTNAWNILSSERLKGTWISFVFFWFFFTCVSHYLPGETDSDKVGSVWKTCGACLSFHIRHRPKLVTGDWNGLGMRGIMVMQHTQECGSRHFLSPTFFAQLNVPLLQSCDWSLITLRFKSVL